MFAGLAKPVQERTTVEVSITGCLPAQGGVGVDLNTSNVILELRDNTAAAIAFEADPTTSLRPGDRVVGIDGELLQGRILTEVIEPLETHIFQVERSVDWNGFSIEDTSISEKDDEEGFVAINHIREVTVQKSDGSVGISTEVVISSSSSDTSVMISKVLPGTQVGQGGGGGDREGHRWAREGVDGEGIGEIGE